MFKIESYKKGIVLSTIFNIFNKGLVFINGLVVAYFFGATHGTDIFFYTYNSLIILSGFIMNTNSAVLIPESMRIRTVEGNDSAIRFLNFFILLYSAIIITGLLLIVLNPVLFFSHISNFSVPVLQQHKELLYLSLPLFGMACLITLFIDILTSYKYFTISMVVGIINGLCSIMLIAALHGFIGVKSAFIGFLLSYLVNILMLQYILRKKLGWNFQVSRKSVTRRIAKNLGFAQLGNLASAASLYTPMYILTGFNAGIITALTFAQQISALPNALITTQFSSVAGIKLNELFARTDSREINRIFSETADVLHFIMIPVSCIIFFYSSQIVAVLADFTSITHEVMVNMSIFLKYLGLLLPFYVSNTLVSRLFMASHKIREAFWYQLTFNLVQIAAVYFALKKFGVIGYPVTLIVIYFLNTVLYYFVEKFYFRIIRYDLILKNFGFFVLINAAIATFIYVMMKVISIDDKWPVLILSSLMHACLLIIANYIFGLNSMISSNIESFLYQVKEKNIFKLQKNKHGV